MSYTIAELDEAIENEESDWEGSWFEFQDQLESGWGYEPVPEGTEGARVRYGVLSKYVEKDKPGLDIPGIGYAIQLDQYGGEDQGTSLWLVFQVTDEDGETRYFKRNGWYQSWQGGEYDGPTIEVQAVEKLVTVYEEI